jgi:hypothetical protein
MNCVSSNVGSSGRHTHCLAGLHVNVELKNGIKSEMVKIHPKVAENGDNGSIKGEAKSSSE